MELGRQVLANPGVEGVIMPGGRWITIGAIRDLEDRYGRPVITNHSASLWATLRDAGYGRGIDGWGRLLSSLDGS
jgi:maleate cis-trans isomerase